MHNNVPAEASTTITGISGHDETEYVVAELYAAIRQGQLNKTNAGKLR